MLPGLIFVIVISFQFCSTDNSTNPSEQDNKEYYPGKAGTNYKYNVEQIDSSGTTKTGNLYIDYGNEVNLNNTKYRIQRDSLSLDTLISSNISYFRRTNTGVFYFVDTNQVLNFVPDSLKDLISLQEEMRLIANPLATGSFWPVFKVIIQLQAISFSPINVSGYFVAQENLTLNLENGVSEVTAEKVKYDMDIITDLNQPIRRFSAFAWYAENIGLVKMEGNGVLIGILLTGEINFDDSTSTVNQNLLKFEIK